MPACKSTGYFTFDNDGNASGLGAAHLFVRDPNRGLVGAYAAYSSDGSGGRDDGFRLGGEGELYLDQFTLSGLAGWDFANEEMFGQAKVSAYVTENTKLYAGYAREGRDYGIIGAEHMFTPLASAYAEGWFGEGGATSGLVGLKLHFGGSGGTSSAGDDVVASNNPPSAPFANEDTLIQRDREEIIPVWMQVCSPDDGSDAEPPQPTTTLNPTEPT